jgi:hypothetical protein
VLFESRVDLMSTIPKARMGSAKHTKDPIRMKQYCKSMISESLITRVVDMIVAPVITMFDYIMAFIKER